MTQGTSSSPQPVQLELAIERTFSMLYLKILKGGLPPQQLYPTYQQTLVLLTRKPVLLRPLLRTIIKELEGLLIAFESEALDRTNSLQTHFPAHN